MTLVILVIVLALIEFTFFSFQVGQARVKYRVDAPAISGHPEFEKRFRIQQNTLEQLVIFVPALLCFAWMAESVGWAGNAIGASLGVVWLIGRFIYAMSYARDPASRGLGFMLTLLPSALMMAGTVILVFVSLV